MKLLLSSAALALLVSAAPAFAQDPVESYYGSIGYAQSSLEIDGEDAGDDEETDFGAVTAQLGGRVNRFLGVEFEGQIGLNDGDIGEGADQGSFGLEYAGAVYGVLAFPISPNAEIYARAGIGTAEFKVELDDEEVGGDDIFRAYGVGASYFFDGRNGVRADYTRYNFGEDEGVETKADSFSISYIRRFR